MADRAPSPELDQDLPKRAFGAAKDATPSVAYHSNHRATPRDLRLCACARALPTSRVKEVVMELFRRLMYFATGGVVDLRTDTEIIARYAKKRLNERNRPTLGCNVSV